MLKRIGRKKKDDQVQKVKIWLIWYATTTVDVPQPQDTATHHPLPDESEVGIHFPFSTYLSHAQLSAVDAYIATT